MTVANGSILSTFIYLLIYLFYFSFIISKLNFCMHLFIISFCVCEMALYFPCHFFTKTFFISVVL
jgi:hypothetical protein